MIPSSATVQYQISDAQGVFRAYAGLGLAYASISSERTKGPLAGRDLQLDDSTGPAVTLGLDMELGSMWFVNLDARWFDIDSTLKLEGAGPERLAIDPILSGLSLGRRLR